MVRPTSQESEAALRSSAGKYRRPLTVAAAPLRPVPGWKGNLCERSLASCLSLFILLPCAALAVYVLLLQTFVLRVEFILAAILLVFYGLELVLGLVSLLAFSR